MKTLISFCLVLMITLMACNKDQFIRDESPVLKKAKVPVSMKADFCMTPNAELPPVLIAGLDPSKKESYLPGGGWLSGTSTHTGILQTANSTMTMISAEFDFNTYKVVWVSTGKNTAANGDYYFYDATAYSNPADGTFTGEVKMRDGVGKFAGATGTVQMVGQGTCWHAEGTLEFAR